MCLCVRVYAHNNIMAPVVVVFFSSAFYVFYYLYYHCVKDGISAWKRSTYII